MPYRADLTLRAERDLISIFQFIRAEDSPAAARWFNGLETTIDLLATLPKRGAVSDFDKKLRFLTYGNKPHIYLIFYRIEARSHTVSIRHIRHGARKPPKRV